MKTQLVLTAIGSDRPGLVQMVATAVAEAGGNWEASRMARLGGKFAGMVLVTFDGEEPGSFREALSALKGRGLDVSVAVAAGDTVSADVGGEPRLLDLELVGNDREGIVSEISRVLSARGVNVEELGTTCESAPMAGGDLFRLRALLAVPRELDLELLERDLEGISAELMIETRLVEGES